MTFLATGGRPAGVATAEAARLACSVWLTGLSGAGKTTIGRLVYDRLLQRGLPAEMLDGDAVREHLSRELGFSKADRDTNVRRIGWVCELLNRHGVFVVAAALSPYDAVREEVRRRIGRFVLVHCTAPLDVLESRDVKGLYRRARAGEIRNFTGIDDPYEPPPAPDVVVLSDGRERPEQSAGQVIAAMERLGYVQG